MSASAGGTFRHLGDEVLHRGHVITLQLSRFTAPDGTEFEREVVRHPGAVSVVPLHDDGSVVLVRQFRAPLGRSVLEIPAGKRDVAGEPPEETARRELVEEIGLEPSKLELLARFHNSVGFCDEESHVFLGTGLREAERDRQGVEESFLEEVRLPLEEAVSMISGGEITDAKTVIGLTAAFGRRT